MKSAYKTKFNLQYIILCFYLIFIDIELLLLPDEKEGITKGLQLIWHACHFVEIVVMTSKDRIREAVNAVKAGARDYVTHPVQPAEAKLVVENIKKFVSIKSELEYLRNKFWQADSLELVQTQNPEMKAVYERVGMAGYQMLLSSFNARPASCVNRQHQKQRVANRRR